MPSNFYESHGGIFATSQVSRLSMDSVSLQEDALVSYAAVQPFGRCGRKDSRLLGL